MFLTSDASVQPDSSAAPPPVYSRLTDREGDETLIEVLRDRQGLVLRAPTRVPRDTMAVDTLGRPVLAAPSLADRGLRLRWTGFEPVSDVGAFRALLAGRAPGFRLFRGDGLTLAGARAALLGRPPVGRQETGWTFAGGHPTSALAVARLATLAARRPALSPEALAMDTGSPWALSETRALMRGLGHRDSLSRDLQDAYAFLKGWDGLYAPTGVAPSIAEAWIAAHREVFGRAPDLRQRLDSLLLRQTLRLGLAHLRDSLGSTAGTWTWDRLSGDLRYPLLGRDVRQGRYAPLASGTGGTVSALLPGPSLVLDSPPGPAVFSLWSTGGEARTRRPSVGRGSPRDGSDPTVVRLWRPLPADAPVLRLVPLR